MSRVGENLRAGLLPAAGSMTYWEQRGASMLRRGNPLLTIVTRAYKRPKMFEECKRSIESQTLNDVEHIILIDDVGIGVPAANKRLRKVKPNGRYVWVVDDDKVLTDDRVIETIATITATRKPGVIICGAQIGDRLLPETWPPVEGYIDSANIIVSREVWMKHRTAWGERIAGDFDFIKSCVRGNRGVMFLPKIVAKTLRVSKGQPEQPFLSIVTRTYRRPTMFAKCKASLDAQTDQDFEHIVIDDKIGVGIAQTYRNFQSLEVRGKFVFVLDDDNLLTDMKFIERLKEFDKNGQPELIVGKIDRNGTMLPAVWPPKHSAIDMMNVVVSRRLWNECRKNFEPKYDGDFEFISAVWQKQPKIEFLDEPIGCTQAVMYGKPEEFIMIGHHVKFLTAVAGLEFVFAQDEIVTVTERNGAFIEGQVRAGHAEDLDEPTPLRDKKIAMKQMAETRARVLIFCPTYRLEAETIHALVNQQGVEFVDLMFTRDNPYPNEKDDYGKNMQLNYEKMRRIALEENYDRVWIVESDIIPPLDALKKMMEIDAPVVSGLYALRQGEPRSNLWRSNTAPNIGTGMELEELRPFWGQTIPISGGCMGCLLLRPETFKDFSFMTNQRGAPDIAFMQYCCQKNFQQIARLDVVCGHKKPSGEILWPDQKRGWHLEHRKAM